MFTERKKEKREVQKERKRFQCLKGSFKNEKRGWQISMMYVRIL